MSWPYDNLASARDELDYLPWKRRLLRARCDRLSPETDWRFNNIRSILGQCTTGLLYDDQRIGLARVLTGSHVITDDSRKIIGFIRGNVSAFFPDMHYPGISALASIYKSKHAFGFAEISSALNGQFTPWMYGQYCLFESKKSRCIAFTSIPVADIRKPGFNPSGALGRLLREELCAGMRVETSSTDVGFQVINNLVQSWGLWKVGNRHVAIQAAGKQLTTLALFHQSFKNHEFGVTLHNPDKVISVSAFKRVPLGRHRVDLASDVGMSYHAKLLDHIDVAASTRFQDIGTVKLFYQCKKSLKDFKWGFCVTPFQHSTVNVSFRVEFDPNLNSTTRFSFSL